MEQRQGLEEIMQKFARERHSLRPIGRLNRDIKNFKQNHPEEFQGAVEAYNEQYSWFSRTFTTREEKFRHMYKKQKYGTGLSGFFRQHPAISIPLVLGSIFLADYALNTPINRNRQDTALVERVLKGTETKKEIDKLKAIQIANTKRPEKGGYAAQKGAGFFSHGKKDGPFSLEDTPTLNLPLIQTDIPFLKEALYHLGRHHFRVPVYSQVREMLRGNKVLTTYHCHFLEPPSKEDEGKGIIKLGKAGINEVVIMDGLIPWRYIMTANGPKLIPYGQGNEGLESTVSDELKLLLGYSNIPMSIKKQEEIINGIIVDKWLDPEKADKKIRLDYFNYLAGYLKSYGVDINSERDVIFSWMKLTVEHQRASKNILATLPEGLVECINRDAVLNRGFYLNLVYNTKGYYIEKYNTSSIIKDPVLRLEITKYYKKLLEEDSSFTEYYENYKGALKKDNPNFPF